VYAYRITCAFTDASPRRDFDGVGPENEVMKMAAQIRPYTHYSAPQTPEHVVVLTWDSPLTDAEIARFHELARQNNATITLCEEK